jgi:hypothetical protein
VDEDQKLRGLGLLAAGFVLGRLTSVGLRHRRARAPVTPTRAELVRQGRVTGPATASWRYAEDQPKKKRKRDLLTNNAVVAGIVSAIVAGTISFLVAYYQSHDAAKQAVVGQQAQVASQMETAAAAFYDTIMNDYNFWINCHTGDNLWPPACPQPPGFNDITAERAKLAAAEFNTSDQNSIVLAVNFESTGFQILNADSRQAAQKQISSFSVEYENLLTRCGQIIQGQQ